NVSQRPVRTSTSEAMSSPTRHSSSSPPCAAACNSSNRLTSDSVVGSSSANSSSTASVKSRPDSKAWWAERICSSGVRRCASPTRGTLLERLEQAARDGGPRKTFDDGLTGFETELVALLPREGEQRVELLLQVGRVPETERGERPVRGRILGGDGRGH